MIFPLFILFVAISVSVIAAYYSIVGLAAIFAAAVIPIIIMASSLEVAKIATTVWLHQNWDRCRLLMKSYLVIAVILLMFITSMGIFGFLSRAHVEQSASSTEIIRQIERKNSEIEYTQETINRLILEIEQLQESATRNDAQIQQQIDTEQQRIDLVIQRAQPAIVDQQRIIDSREESKQNRLNELRAQSNEKNSNLQNLDILLSQNQVRALQTLVGVRADGSMGPETRQAIADYRARSLQERNEIDREIARLVELQDTDVVQARQEILRIRAGIDEQINRSNALIERLRSEIAVTVDAGVVEQIESNRATVLLLRENLTNLNDERFEFETQYRMLEIEVGPLKYIAELLYGESNPEILEKAVKWVIIIIIFVFDPLAIMLVLAAVESIKWHRQENKPTNNIPPPDTDVKEPENLDHTLYNHNPLCYSYTYELGSVTSNNKQPEPEPEPEPIKKSEENVKERNPSHTQVPVLNQKVGNDVSENKKNSNPKEEIKELGADYVEVDGKVIHKRTLNAVRPDIKHVSENNEIMFGTNFPANPAKDQCYVRVDIIPTKLYKYNGAKWVEVDKSITNNYSFNEGYIRSLVDLIDKGVYDPHLLTLEEQEQIENFLKKKANK